MKAAEFEELLARVQTYADVCTSEEAFDLIKQLVEGRPKLQLDLVKFVVKEGGLTRREVEQRLVAIGQPPMSPAMIAELWPDRG